MMKFKKILRVTIESLTFCFASSMLTNFAFAGAADMTTSEGSKMKFEYAGDKLRINTGQEGVYLVVNDDGLYAVTNASGQIMVVDAGKMIGMFGNMSSTAPSVASSQVVSLEATGTTESRADISGEIYNLKYIDRASGDVKSSELVLSGDSRAVEMTKAINSLASAMIKATGQDQKGINELQQQMAKLDKGILRYGNDMWVTAISNRAIASNRFALPAAPQDLSAISGIADAIKAQSATTSTSEQLEGKAEKKGLVSGFLSAFGKKADEQADRQKSRAESQADDAADEAVDEAVDNVLDKALGKIFGN
ncbi:MAG: hypothetical protein V7459_02190 [Oceanicoccus sp.]